MGQNFSSEPVVEKETESDHNDTFNVAVSSCQGWRMSQEDNHSMMLNLPGEHKAAFFAVYDGHGSAKVSKHASEGLWRHLVENEMYLKGNFEEALESAFLTFDREVDNSYNAQLAGTTAVCLLIVNNTIYCANIGDSRGVACVNCECVPLSYDHKPENPLELKRILAAGGYVLGNRVNGNLALSRAFGDFHYKGNELLPAEQQIVSPCPDVKSIELNDDVDFLVLACDGIWDVLSSEEVVEFVISRLEQDMKPGLICEQLTTRCLATDYELVIGCDNMTVLLVCYTRGRSWEDFCTDIFNKHSNKLGIQRVKGAGLSNRDWRYANLPTSPVDDKYPPQELLDELRIVEGPSFTTDADQSNDVSAEQPREVEGETLSDSKEISDKEPEQTADHNKQTTEERPEEVEVSDDVVEADPKDQVCERSEDKGKPNLEEGNRQCPIEDEEESEPVLEVIVENHMIDSVDAKEEIVTNEEPKVVKEEEEKEEEEEAKEEGTNIDSSPVTTTEAPDLEEENVEESTSNIDH